MPHMLMARQLCTVALHSTCVAISMISTWHWKTELQEVTAEMDEPDYLTLDLPMIGSSHG